jgi:hypothetical protein
MGKHLFVFAVFTFFLGISLCKAQPDAAARKTGPLSTSSSSGSAAGGGVSWTYIDTSRLTMFDIVRAAFCLDSDSTMTLGAYYDDNNGGSWYYGDSALETLSDNVNHYDSVIINQPGIYYYKSYYAGTVGIIITSTIPLDNFPGKTIFCPGGSITLHTPKGYSAVQWYNNDDLIEGATFNTYVASDTGHFYVKAANVNNCVLNSEKITVNIYSPPNEIDITGDSNIILNNSMTDLNPDGVDWYRNGVLIKSFNDQGIIVAGGNGAGKALNQFDQPYGLFVDSMKNIYVADYNNSRVIKWKPGNNTGEEVASADLFGANPTDVATDGQLLYVSGGEDYVNEFNLSNNSWVGTIGHDDPGNHLWVWGLSENSNHDLYFAANRYFYVRNSAGEIIETIDIGGGVYSSVTAMPVGGGNSLGTGLTNINYPNGIYVDSINNLYVADNLSDSLNNFYGRIVRWEPGAPSGELIAGTGPGYNRNQISFAAGVTFDKYGNMYVTDPINYRVQLWKPGADHGITVASGFAPWGVKVDDSMCLYVADQTNNQILKFPSLLHNTIKVDTPGVYKAIVTYPGGCTVTSNEFIVTDLLPVTLINFTCQLKNNDAVLSWQTASEHNISYFNVQRSVDGVNFTSVGKVFANGNSSSLNNYAYNDNEVTSLNVNKIYYRLNELENDGKSIQSKIISIDIKKYGWNFTISPNPVRSLLKIQINNLHGNTNVSLIDLTARKLGGQQINASGSDVLNFNTANLNKGLYIIQVINNGQSEYLKFVKE